MQITQRDPKFHNKDGSLTRYSFACGYLEMTKLKDNGRDIQVWMGYEGACFFVRGHDYNSNVPDPQGNCPGRLFWECFESDEMVKARAFYRKKVRELRKAGGA